MTKNEVIIKDVNVRYNLIGKEYFILRVPNVNDEIEIMSYKKEFAEIGDYINGSDGLTTIKNYKDWLKKLAKDKTGSPKRSELLMIRKSDNKVVGLANIRHSVENGFEISGGHIGYSIRPSERGKGYGNVILALSLDYCKRLGIKKVLVTCEKNNLASKKVIIYNSGKFENEIIEEDKMFERYWISI